jgi:hypothetical protein
MKLPKKLMCQKCDAFIQSYVPNFCEDVADSWPSAEQMNRRLSTPVYTCERPWDQVKYGAAKARKEQSRRCKQIYKLLGQHKKTLIDANSIIVFTELDTETPLHEPCSLPTVAPGTHRNDGGSQGCDANSIIVFTELDTETPLHEPCSLPTVAQSTHRNDGGSQSCDGLSSNLPFAITALEQLANATIIDSNDTSAKAAVEENPRRRCFGWYGKKYNRLFQQAVKSACPLQGITMETTGVVEIPDQFPLHRVYNSIGGVTELQFYKEINLGSYVLRSSKCDGTAAGDNKLLCEKCVLLSRITNAVVRKAKAMEKDDHKDILFTKDRINAMMDAAPAEPDISTMAAETVPDADETLPEDEDEDVVETLPDADNRVPENTDDGKIPRRRCFGWYGNKYDLIFQQALKSVSPLRGITMETTGVVEIPDQFPLHRVYNSIGGATELLFCKENNLGSYVLCSSKCDKSAPGRNNQLCEKCALLKLTTFQVVKKACRMEKDTNERINLTEDRINVMSDAATLKLVQRMRKDRDVNARNIRKRSMRGVDKSSKKTKRADDLKTLRYASALDTILPQIRL